MRSVLLDGIEPVCFLLEHPCFQHLSHDILCLRRSLNLALALVQLLLEVLDSFVLLSLSHQLLLSLGSELIDLSTSSSALAADPQQVS